jgi:hypothetical protein
VYTFFIACLIRLAIDEYSAYAFKGLRVGANSETLEYLGAIMRTNSRASIRLVCQFALMLAIMFGTSSAIALELDLLGTINASYYNNDFAIYGEYAYVSADDGLLLLDISDPTNIVIEDVLLEGGLFKSLEIVENYLIAGRHQDGVDVYEIVSPTNLVFHTNASIQYGGWFDRSGEVLFVSMESMGVAALDLSVLPELPILDWENTSNYAHHLVTYGNYLYVANGWDGLTVFDVSDPTNMLSLGNFADSDSENFNGVCLSSASERIYVADNWAGLHSLDCSDPASPIDRDYHPIAREGILCNAVAFGHIFTAGYNNLLYAFVDDPAGPPFILAESLPLPGENTVSLKTSGDFIYLCGVTQFSIVQHDALSFNVSLTPTTETEIPASGGTVSYQLHFQNYQDIFRSGVQFWSTAITPDETEIGPLFMANFTMIPFMDVAPILTVTVPGNIQAGEYEYIGHVGLYPNFDVVNDSFIFTKLPGILLGENEWKHSELTFESDEFSCELELIPSKLALHPAYPNPFNPTTSISVSLPVMSELKVAVFDVLGREVARLAEGRYSAGTHPLTFDGSKLASGVYFVQIEVSGHGIEIQKITLLK